MTLSIPVEKDGRNEAYFRSFAPNCISKASSKESNEKTENITVLGWCDILETHCIEIENPID